MSITTIAMCQLKIDNSGNIGVGINTPAQKLHVFGTATVTNKLGIGANTPLEKFQIGDLWTFHDGGSKFIGYNKTYSPSGSVRIAQGFASSITFNSNGNISLETAGTGAAGSAVNSTGKNITLTAAGNVGIGTTTDPTHKLHVVGNTYLEGKVGIGLNTPPDPTYSLIVNHPFCIKAWKNIIFDCSGTNGIPAMYASGDASLQLGQSDKRIYNIHVININGAIYKSTSDEQAKENIKHLENPLEKIKQIRGYHYNFKKEIFPEHLSEETIAKLTKTQIGFIAQEVEKVFPELVTPPESEEKFCSLNYNGMIPVLFEAIKEQQNMIENLQKEVEFLKESLIECCNTNNPKTMENNESNNIQQFNLTDPIHTEEMKVYQNAPNPFDVQTTIQCYIPQTIKKAELCVYNMQGVQVKCLTVFERGNVSVQIQAGQLTAGIYTYLLIGDGKTSDAKQMILTK